MKLYKKPKRPTDLPVLKPFMVAGSKTWTMETFGTITADRRILIACAIFLMAWLSVDVVYAQLQSDSSQSAFATLVKWT
ncbi:MAG: hypothetical protein ACJA0I_001244, partial [Gammaproteobacteria bacterium]